MLNVGLFELVFFISFALIFLGPEKLVELLKTAYGLYQKVKQLLQNFQTDIERELKLNELQEKLESEINKVKDLEKTLSQKIYAELHSDEPIYIGLPYSSLGKIEAVSPMDQAGQLDLYPLSYTTLNEHILTPSYLSRSMYS